MKPIASLNDPENTMALSKPKHSYTLDYAGE